MSCFQFPVLNGIRRAAVEERIRFEPELRVTYPVWNDDRFPVSLLRLAHHENTA